MSNVKFLSYAETFVVSELEAAMLLVVFASSATVAASSRLGEVGATFPSSGGGEW